MHVSKRTTGSVIAGILCSVLLLAAVAGAATALYMGAKNNGWFDKDDTEVTESVDELDSAAESTSEIEVADSSTAE